MGVEQNTRGSPRILLSFRHEAAHAIGGRGLQSNLLLLHCTPWCPTYRGRKRGVGASREGAEQAAGPCARPNDGARDTPPFHVRAACPVKRRATHAWLPIGARKRECYKQIRKLEVKNEKGHKLYSNDLMRCMTQCILCHLPLF